MGVFISKSKSLSETIKALKFDFGEIGMRDVPLANVSSEAAAGAINAAMIGYIDDMGKRLAKLEKSFAEFEKPA